MCVNCCGICDDVARRHSDEKVYRAFFSWLKFSGPFFPYSNRVDERSEELTNHHLNVERGRHTSCVRAVPLIKCWFVDLGFYIPERAKLARAITGKPARNSTKKIESKSIRNRIR